MRWLIDPPLGHAHGFPKPFDGDLDTLDVEAWLRANGYPDELIASVPGGRGCRIIGPLETND